MSDPKILKCIKCGCELGKVYKATLKTKCVYICQDCYNANMNSFNKQDDSNMVNRMKEMFNM